MRDHHPVGACLQANRFRNHRLRAGSYGGFLLGLVLTVVSGTAFAQNPRPNIIFILADDLGYGDLSSYGATDIDTPNIDRLAAEGIRFSDHYAPANTCSPSRASLLTGRYPPRTGVNAVLNHNTVEGLPHDEITLAELLRDTGYATGMVGKWHLGPTENFMPWHHGFDVYYGVNTANDDKNFFLYEATGSNYRRIPEPVDQTLLTQQYNARALAFIEQYANGDKPFFLYFAHTDPHVPLHPAPQFAGTSRRGIYGDVINELDDSVGRMLAKLEAVGIADTTLVIFSSDNGGWRTMRDHGGSNGILREGKLTTFEGGHRVPALARWPERIPQGQTYDGTITMMDWFPTIAHLLGLALPQDRVIDGVDLTQVLSGTGQRAQAPYFYFALRTPVEKDQSYKLAGVRLGKWKYKRAQSGFYPQVLERFMRVGLYFHGELLFDLEADPGETTNVIGDHPEVAERLRGLITDFEANNTMRKPVAHSAAPADRGGWGNLWWGIAQGMLASLLVIGLAIYGLVWYLPKVTSGK